MSVDNKKEVEKSQQSSDEHCTGSTLAEPDTTIYQNLLHDEHNATIPGWEADATQGFSQIGAIFTDEKSTIDLNLEIERVVKS
ncbi:uncharacterized protein BHQ10_010189 [Talaromyces amestolkiae]|uniref:Uncharacterized protein n=1 Tax=Talaromyces amestolkiae TaxID=1196081 RepID=A0A364LEF7_TALAM|nr:uncharacterized protein BHQ10_010189 [Talaromyces amestolkiae]RAO74177.1 hypothetical protein BHQ10_010189 [Talaromyces amestolkiae]